MKKIRPSTHRTKKIAQLQPSRRLPFASSMVSLQGPPGGPDGRFVVHVLEIIARLRRSGSVGAKVTDGFALGARAINACGSFGLHERPMLEASQRFLCKRQLRRLFLHFSRPFKDTSRILLGPHSVDTEVVAIELRACLAAVGDRV